MKALGMGRLAWVMQVDSMSSQGPFKRKGRRSVRVEAVTMLEEFQGPRARSQGMHLALRSCERRADRFRWEDKQSGALLEGRIPNLNLFSLSVG